MKYYFIKNIGTWSDGSDPAFISYGGGNLINPASAQFDSFVGPSISEYSNILNAALEADNLKYNNGPASFAYGATTDNNIVTINFKFFLNQIELIFLNVFFY